MEVNWIIERGNTRWKTGIFEDDLLVESMAFNTWDIDLLPKSKPDNILLTGSGSWSSTLAEELTSLTRCSVIEFKRGDSHPLKTKVENPGSLGSDRIANSYAIQHVLLEEFKERRAWLAVDAGTCLTIDLVVDGVHHGGTISPGINMRLKSMSDGTADLPLVENDMEIGGLGLSTETALIEGAKGGVSAEITGVWLRLREEYPQLGVVLTGGSSNNLELGQVNTKFADSNLTLKGYNALLHHFTK
jgi:type III pantothenate kinase